MDRDITAALSVFGCGSVGVILAVIEYVLYDAGILFDEFITGSISLPDLMAITIVIWVIIGVILAVVRS